MKYILVSVITGITTLYSGLTILIHMTLTDDSLYSSILWFIYQVIAILKGLI